MRAGGTMRERKVAEPVDSGCESDGGDVDVDGDSSTSGNPAATSTATTSTTSTTGTTTSRTTTVESAGKQRHARSHGSRNAWCSNSIDIAAAIVLLAPSVYMALHIPNATLRFELAWALLIAAAAFVATYVLVPIMKDYTLKAGLGGKDLGKKGTTLGSRMVPESLGIVCGVVFLVAIILGQLVVAQSPDTAATLNAAMLSICFMVFLGFADDVLDLRWRYKLILPTIASLPIMCQYTGITSVVMPTPVRGLVAFMADTPAINSAISMLVTIDPSSAGAVVDLGLLYYVYMLLLAVFCTNSINIYAGINGLEVGQAYVITAAVLFTNVLELSRPGATEDHPHLFSAIMLAPFIGTVAGLLKYNWFPATVFVGDTFCYFAGMTLAVVGILGHFSKTLMLFFLPQILNFLYSLPQLSKYWECPRHRLPWYDPATDTMSPSRFMQCKHTDKPCERDNCTVICLALRVFGPMHERNLTRLLLAFQVLCCLTGIGIRYGLSTFVYDE